MQSEEPVAIGERVTALAVVVEPRRAGDDDAPGRSLRVVDALYEVSPAGVFVDLVEDQERLAGRKLAAA